MYIVEKARRTENRGASINTTRLRRLEQGCDLEAQQLIILNNCRHEIQALDLMRAATCGPYPISATALICTHTGSPGCKPSACAERRVKRASNGDAPTSRLTKARAG